MSTIIQGDDDNGDGDVDGGTEMKKTTNDDDDEDEAMLFIMQVLSLLGECMLLLRETITMLVLTIVKVTARTDIRMRTMLKKQQTQ